ncbi:acyltransferase domain-containing protein, partial [Streptomyces sp. NPDC059165]|uniref:acyltransferase domain-containing protein n=1 Tax=Streptomyces sp. NPDC059165 TaxID=3346751 RepID=UPI00369F5660
GRVAFVFAGQGAQRVGMGLGLYGAFPVFAGAFDAVVAELDPLLGVSLRGVIESGVGLDGTGLTQPALFAVEVALFRLVESWGVVPDFVAGHSVGELAAAHVAGVLSLGDAARLVVARGSLMEGLPLGGAMVAVEASEEEVLPLVEGCGGRVSVAAVNGPSSVVVSGDEDAVSAVVSQVEVLGRRTKRLVVSHAFHSPLMDGMLEEFGRVAEGVGFGAPVIPVVSTLSGRVASGGELVTAGYWVDQVRGAVRFADAVRTLEASGVTSFLEIGPDGVLSGMVAESVLDRDVVTAVPVLRRGRSEAHTVLSAVGRLHVAGVPVDWSAYFSAARPRRVDLPTYAFQ